jgi:hypothetical protein
LVPLFFLYLLTACFFGSFFVVLPIAAPTKAAINGIGIVPSSFAQSIIPERYRFRRDTTVTCPVLATCGTLAARGVQIATTTDCFGRCDLQGCEQTGKEKGRSKGEEKDRAKS